MSDGKARETKRDHSRNDDIEKIVTVRCAYRTVAISSRKFTIAEMLTINLHTALEIALRTTAVYLLVLGGIRLTGKREVGQMTPFDLTLLLLLSNSVQNAMTGPDTSLIGGGIAALILLTLNFLLAEVSGINRRFRKMIQGSPT